MGEGSTSAGDTWVEARHITHAMYAEFPRLRRVQSEAIVDDQERLRMVQRTVWRRLFESGQEVQTLVEDLFDEARERGLLAALQLTRQWLETREELPHARVLRALDLFVTHHPLAIEAQLSAPPLHMQSRFLRGNDRAGTDFIDRDWIEPREPCTMSLAYWHEDYHRNLSHFKWHIVFFHGGIPDPAAPRSGARRLTMERQGESFLYMHQQMMARYEAERLSWGLPETKPFSDYTEVISEGYDPPARMLAETPHWPFPYLARPANHGLVADIPEYDGPDTTLGNLQKLEANILRCIEEGKVPGTDVALTEHVLGSLLEVNVEGRRYSTTDYGIEGLHNGIHDNFSLIGRREDSTHYGVMGTTQDSSRDPIFYRVHRHLDDIRHKFCEKQPAVDLFAHAPEGITISTFRLEHEGAALRTVLGPSRFLYERGKLDHAPFAWHISLVVPEGSSLTRVTARIFICPRKERDQRRMWIEMDKFSIPVVPGQTVTLRRADHESSIARKEDEDSSSERASRFCDCGWPQNLMVPAGCPEGLEFVACLLLTTNDLAVRTCRRCRTGDEITACGSLLNGGKYPDALGMGYPFHRRFAQEGAITDVLARLPHAALHSFTVARHSVSIEHLEGRT